MITVQINHETPTKLGFDPEQFVRKVLAFKHIHSGFFEFTFASESTIRHINKTHLSHDYVTDIITFDLGDNTHIMADIYICPAEAKRNADALDHSLDTEIQTLLIHGILHLLDYDDTTPAKKRVMTREQNRILKSTKI